MAKKKRSIQNVKNDIHVKELMRNAFFGGINELIMGFDPGNFGTPLNSLNTLWINNRWYLASNMRQLLSESYVEHGLIQTICRVPVEDAFRGGLIIKSKELDPQDIEELTVEMEDEGDLEIASQTEVWNRLFGGAGTVIMTGDDPEAPLDIDKMTDKDPLAFRATDMWELFWNHQNTEDYSLAIDGSQLDIAEYYNYYGHKLHTSRVLKRKGIEAPSLIRPRLRGWGTSVVEVFINSLNQYLKSNNLIFEILDEFKVDYYKLKNLTNNLVSPTSQQKVQQRIQSMNRQKNYNHAVVMDKEDDWEQKQLTFTGIAETMIGIKQCVAADLRMPLTKVFGISAAGFSSGEDDIENYNAMIESSIRTPVKKNLTTMVKIRCKRRFGFIPEDLQISYQPLRMLSAEQEERVKDSKFNRLQAARTSGDITTKEYRDAINKDKLLPIQLEVDDAALNEIDDAKADQMEMEMKSKEPKGVGEPKKSKINDTPAAKNSLQYDKAAFLADGGEKQFAPWHQRYVYELPNHALLEKAKSASVQAFGKESWQFILWFYKAHEGSFK